MERLQKQVIVAGLALIVAGLLFGLAMNYTVDHQARLVVNESYSEAFRLLSAGGSNDAVAKVRDEAEQKTLNYSRAVGFHTHSINMGLLVVLAGVLLPLIGTGGQRNLALYGFVFAACLYPMGLLLTLSGFELIGEVVAAAGAGLAIAAFAVIGAGVALFDYRTKHKDK